ncbi:MAG: bifunctional hydroxymethylpyrimidine kinase/phosphomethylpyrimidine kinase [Verrucomicrobiota bacterium]
MLRKTVRPTKDDAMSESMTPVALTIAGSDSGAGAGAQADLLTFAAHGVFGTTALTCLTAQNPTGVAGVRAVEPDFVTAQCEQVRAHFRPTAAKTGMLLEAAIVRAVAGFIRSSGIPVVVDPVMVATSGATLLRPEAIEALRKELIPLAAVVTPNLDEAAILLGRKAVGGKAAASEASELARAFGAPFLVKGGHGQGDALVDALAWPDGRAIELHSVRVHGVDTHGSGCTLSAAIAAGLAKGHDLGTSVRQAHAYLQEAIRRPLPVAGLRCIRHL